METNPNEKQRLGDTGEGSSIPTTLPRPPDADEAMPLANVQVFAPPPDRVVAEASGSGSTPTPPEADPVPDTFFEPSISDVQAYHASVISRSKRLNEAPLLTSKYREADRAERDKKKSQRWPTTTIRIKFSDGTQVQNTFPSTSPIQPVYAFVRSTLDPSASAKPFVLWQPPRYQYPETPPEPPTKKPNPHKTSIIPPAQYGHVKGSATPGLQGGQGGSESLNELGLVPQSVLLVRWEDEAMNASGQQAPLLPHLLDKIVPLPIPGPKEATKSPDVKTEAAKPSAEKKIPKWLQKGLLKKT